MSSPPISPPDDEVRAATLRLVGDYQTLIGQQRWDEWIALWAEDGVLDFPFAPAGRQRTYRGKGEILAYMSATPGRVAIDRVDQLRILPMQDPAIAVVEVTIKGHAPATGAPYDQTYVLFFETKAGKLWRYREYWNPLVSIDAMGGRETWAAGFGSPLASGRDGGAA
ncbi:MAG: nuclear transport factor 2 family protein [Caulobacteraceae bacterium]|nr:nuclear transport factor 2 family protein [Caulobacteraceae bacterium]